jgi:hypothetical protein
MCLIPDLTGCCLETAFIITQASHKKESFRLGGTRLNHMATGTKLTYILTERRPVTNSQDSKFGVFHWTLRAAVRLWVGLCPPTTIYPVSSVNQYLKPAVTEHFWLFIGVS